jgi:hypothetical protein
VLERFTGPGDRRRGAPAAVSVRNPNQQTEVGVGTRCFSVAAAACSALILCGALAPREVHAQSAAATAASPAHSRKMRDRQMLRKQQAILMKEQAVLQQREAALRQQQAVLKERQATLQRRTAELAQKRAQLSRLQRQLQRMQSKLDAMQKR